MGLRETKRARLHRQIVDAGVALFVREGFERTTAEQIAREVSVSPRTLFRYFKAKEDIVFHDVQAYTAAFEQMVAALVARPGSLVDDLRKTALVVAQQIDRNAEQLWPRVQLVYASPLLLARWRHLDAIWRSGLERIMTSRAPTRARAATIAAAALVGSFNALIESWVKAKGAVNVGEMVREVFELMTPLLEQLEPPARGPSPRDADRKSTDDASG
jgi:AcrR family transcriptional regulator